MILLFYLLVTPEVRNPTFYGPIPWSIPIAMAAVFFLFPIIFFCMMWWTKYEKDRTRLTTYLAVTLAVGFWLYLQLVFAAPVGFLSLDPNELNVFAAVVFASSPGVFRIVRGLTLDIKTRDYVAASTDPRPSARGTSCFGRSCPTRGGPLIVDSACASGTRPSCSGPWVSSVSACSRNRRRLGFDDQPRPQLRASDLDHPPVAVPGAALMTLVLGLNLLADGLREESLKD